MEIGGGALAVGGVKTEKRGLFEISTFLRFNRFVQHQLAKPKSRSANLKHSHWLFENYQVSTNQSALNKGSIQ